MRCKQEDSQPVDIQSDRNARILLRASMPSMLHVIQGIRHSFKQHVRMFQPLQSFD